MLLWIFDGRSPSSMWMGWSAMRSRTWR